MASGRKFERVMAGLAFGAKASSQNHVQVFTGVMGTNSAGWHSNTLVVVIPTSKLSPLMAASKIRLTMAAATTKPTGVASAYIGHKAASGDSYDFAATPVAITVGGNASFTIPQSGSSVSDEIAFAYNGTSDLVIAFSFSSNTSENDIRTGNALGNGCLYFFKASANDAATVNKSSYGAASNNPDALAIITKVEML